MRWAACAAWVAYQGWTTLMGAEWGGKFGKPRRMAWPASFGVFNHATPPLSKNATGMEWERLVNCGHCETTHSRQTYWMYLNTLHCVLHPVWKLPHCCTCVLLAGCAGCPQLSPRGCAQQHGGAGSDGGRQEEVQGLQRQAVSAHPQLAAHERSAQGQLNRLATLDTKRVG